LTHEDVVTVEALASAAGLVLERSWLEGQLVQSQTMEGIAQLAGGVAHDFNNLLFAIGGYAELLAGTFEPDDLRRRDVASIQQATEKAADLTRELLAFSRKQDLRPTLLDLSHVVRGIEPALRRFLGGRVTLVLDLAPDLAPVLIDARRMESIIVGLVINARDAIAGAGIVTIGTANVELDASSAHLHAEVIPGPYAMVSVSDTGTGIEPELLERIFQPFFTTKEVGQGSGLGLAAVYGTVRQSGGHIWVYSELGHGTAFKIYLPRRDAPVAPVAVFSDAAAPAGGDETILVVEDDALVREVVIATLRRRGYRVIAVDSAAAALEAIEASTDGIDLLLSDVVMPGMGGPELVEVVRADRPGLPVVMMSGYTANTMEQYPIPTDVQLLEKPFTSDSLDEAVRTALGAERRG
jgi:nitrogen-specific signal transduction histidine kinase/ActR/RegA family two-component response regulator